MKAVVFSGCRFLIGLGLILLISPLDAQELARVAGVEPQPVLAQAIRLNEALAFLGSRLQPEDEQRLLGLRDHAADEELVALVQEILDPYCIAMVEINPEARVKVLRGPAQPELIQGGWKSFLVKVHNQAEVKAPLEVGSPNAEPILHRSTGRKRVAEKNVLSPGDMANRFLELAMYRSRPLQSGLSGLHLEYAVVQIYTSEVGRREAKISFHVGQGTQDIGFRNAIDVLFNIQPSVRVKLRVKDHDGSPAMASFTITDGIERLVANPEVTALPDQDYRLSRARTRTWDRTLGVGITPVPYKRLVGLYPLPSRRLSHDPYPDFFFHPQVYRADGEHVSLPPGNYQVEYTRGPEYLIQHTELNIPATASEYEVTFQLERWVDMAGLGWYSLDHHVHAAGCSHYESPEEGVRPGDMWRQALGEDLKVSCVLAWGPCWYHQKQYFEGKDHELSTDEYVMRYDVEVSGFPSSHAGHLVLLRLNEDDYPGTTKVEEWPSWTLPVLKWAKSQGGAVGYSHSGWGLAPQGEKRGDTPLTRELPNYIIPNYDSIGANEYVVTITHDAVDFYSLGDTPSLWELNMWYHSLNVGYRVRGSGETDFPCIFDERVGMARTYAKLDNGLDFDQIVDEIKAGRSYVSDGKSHIIDFRANHLELGTNDSELQLKGPQTVRIQARVAAFLPEEQDEIGAFIGSREHNQPPYWDLERARIGTSRRVPVELIVNGVAVAKQDIVADGDWNNLIFEHDLDKSSWIAVRILTSSHTNPIFVLVDGKPIRSRESVEWCLKGVEKCWEMKVDRIREDEREAARAAYDHAQQVYTRMLEDME